MELLLNEKSLDEQFFNIDDFYDALSIMSKNLQILRKLKIPVLKHSSIYSRKITKDMTINDLKNSNGLIKPNRRDEVKKWKRELSLIVMEPPFWDMEKTESADSLTEAARRKTDIVSFLHKDYTDRTIKVKYCNEDVFIKSAVSSHFLTELLYEKEILISTMYLKFNYGEKRISFEKINTNEESIKSLEKSEFDELIVALNRFDMLGTWREILSDRFFDYKSYKPRSKKKDYFVNTEFADRDIDKFRCGQHSQVRCFGYRQDDKFYVVHIERDHSVSDTG